MNSTYLPAFDRLNLNDQETQGNATLADLQKCVQSLFLDAFASATLQSAKQQLNHFRMAILGPDRIIGLIENGYTHEQIGTFIAKKHDLQEVFRSVEGEIRDLALGVSVILVGSQMQKTASELDTPTLSATIARLQQLQQIKQNEMESMHISEFGVIDYQEVYSYVESEIKNGNLTGDPVWVEKARSKVTKRKVGWMVLLHEALNALATSYDDAALSMDWSETILHDTLILSKIRPEVLYKLIIKNYNRDLSRILFAPLREGQQEAFSSTEVDQITQIGVQLRTRVVDEISMHAYEALQAKEFEKAQTLYLEAFEAGANNPRDLINRAVALSALGRFEDAQTACTIALGLIDAVGNCANRRSSQDETSRSRTGMQGEVELLGQLTTAEEERWHHLCTTQHQSLRTRAFRATKQELDSLRWRAYVRRGRAYKQILQKLGGIHGSIPHEDVREESQDEDGANHIDEEDLARRRGEALLYARSDFGNAIMLDPLQNIPRKELIELTIDPLQRRFSQDGQRFSLASIHSVAMQRRSISL
ncbi:uncharacterized protein FA14DRAFT_80224 [Meira miltonrushii]|uniref:Uncharacterized protein n=1 Tax=Meira miltonrushii TaxID=1280837 RepID=A0A316VBS4_9BASI|nr:uncharacterized protein FA14DRAFT_80224 [Meira miltonrushii]PWN33005.1 hypothetical protein FA14DRAFT_80224 [Meira miltonrushii]